ncbi:type III secretion system protein PrgF [Carnobacterium maltaromaticum]|uniref:type III secretion system protein PrgF n=1 Tax=Carnobacterium maltaromaticum TaxID=2751 RepID=UPI0012FB0A12|nr:type III secretion system protein PrgF [Carnobacterium maltaromaticum]
MDMITKIVTLLGAIIGISSAVSVLFGISEIRSGLANDDSRTLDKGTTKVIVGGAMLVAIAGIVTYILTQVNSITF